VIRRHSSDPAALAVIDEVEVQLQTVVGDCVQLELTIEQLNPTDATRTLKVALRQRASATEPDTPEIESLRRRHDTVHGLMNRLYALRSNMDRILVEVDTLVAQSVTASIAPAGHDPILDVQIRQLTSDAAALAAAHDELAHL